MNELNLLNETKRNNNYLDTSSYITNSKLKDPNRPSTLRDNENENGIGLLAQNSV